jgi:hypothetical protein
VPVMVGVLLIVPLLAMSILSMPVPLAVMLVHRPGRDDRSRWRYALAGQSVDDVHGSPSLDALSGRLNRMSYGFVNDAAQAKRKCPRNKSARPSAFGWSSDVGNNSSDGPSLAKCARLAKVTSSVSGTITFATLAKLPQLLPWT